MNKRLIFSFSGLIAAILIACLAWTHTMPTAQNSTGDGGSRLTEQSEPAATQGRNRQSWPRVRVSDSAGRPIVGAAVCSGVASGGTQFTTDKNGEALLSEIPDGPARLLVHAEGFLGITIELPVARKTCAEVTLSRFASLNGMVRGFHGEPVEGARITIEYAPPSDPSIRFVVVPEDNAIVPRTVESLSNGCYEIALAIPNRNMTLHVEHPKYAHIELSLTPLAPEEFRSVELVLPETTGIQCTVSLGTPAEAPVRLRVWSVLRQPMAAVDLVRDLMVKPEVLTEIHDLLPGEYLLEAHAEAPRQVVVATAQVMVEAGRITDAGRLTPGSSVLRLLCVMEPELYSRQIELGVRVLKPIGSMMYVPCDIEVSGDDARDFTVVGLPHGYSIAEARVIGLSPPLSDPVWLEAKHRFTLGDNTEVNLIITRRPPPTEIHVYLDLPPSVAKEAISAFVWLENENGVVSSYSRRAEGNTRFKFGLETAVSTGSVTLRAVANGYTLTRTGIAVLPQQAIEVRAGDWIRGEPCEGQVFDEAGRPAANATIEFAAAQKTPNGIWYQPVLCDVIADTDGRFAVAALPRCKELRVTASTESAHSAPHEIGTGAATGIVLRLHKRN